VLQAVQRVIDDILNPLLQKDESSIELLDVSEDEVVVRVTGRAAFGVGAEYVRSGVLERALGKVVRNDGAVRMERSIRKARRRS